MDHEADVPVQQPQRTLHRRNDRLHDGLRDRFRRLHECRDFAIDHQDEGGIVGTATCANGRSGTFLAYEVEAGYQGFASRYSADFGGGCVEAGRIGGMKQE